MKYQISNEALFDIKEIWNYTFINWSENQAEEYYDKLLDHIEYLAQHPLTGVDFSQSREGYRYSPIGSHAIFYYSDNEFIFVVRVLHQSMDALKHLDFS